jgi:hypothetical protein
MWKYLGEAVLSKLKEDDGEDEIISQKYRKIVLNAEK